MLYTRQALLKGIPCLSHARQSHVLHMAIFTLLSQDLYDQLPQTLQLIIIIIIIINTSTK